MGEASFGGFGGFPLLRPCGRLGTIARMHRIGTLACAVMLACGSSAPQPGAPAERPFRMGFVYQPYDWGREAFEETGRFIAENGDLLVCFADIGVPWEEAATGAPFPAALEDEIRRCEGARRPHQTFALAAGFLAEDRVSLAATFGERALQPREGAWAQRGLGDPETAAAYLAYLQRLAERLEPDYLVYGLEVDTALTDVEDRRFQRMLTLVRTVYPALKEAYPQTPIVLEFVLGDEAEAEKRQAAVDALLPYTDAYAVSLYPFHYDSVGGDAGRIAEDWLSKAHRIAPGKPLAVLETAYAGESFYHPELGIPVPGRADKLLIPSSEEQQRAYVEWLLGEAARLDALFVSWWTPRDLDPLFDRIQPHPMSRLVEDAGMVDEAGEARPALEVWRSWAKAEHRPD